MKPKVYAINLDSECNQKLEYSSQKLFGLYTLVNLDTIKKTMLYTINDSIFIIDLDVDTRNMIKLISVLRAKNNIIICLSSSTNEYERIRYYNYGVSRIISKPYLYEEIIYSVLLSNANYGSFIISDYNFLIDLKNGRVFFKNNEIFISRKILSLLILFIENEGQVLSRDFLSLKVNNNNNNKIESRNIDTMISKLRKCTSFSLFQSKRGVGYIYHNIDC